MKYFLVVCAVIAVQSRTTNAEDVFVSEQPEMLWNEGEFTEGVAVRSDGMVFFSDIPSGETKGRILMFDPATRQTSVFCSDSRKSNGLFFDSGDRLYACCGADGGARALCEVTADGDVQVVVDGIQGRRFNAPNDLVVHPSGVIYFSDPRYRGSEPMEAGGMFVYRFDPRTKQVTIATREIEKPNGVHVSPDGKTLYVAETNNGSTGMPDSPPAEVGRMTLNAFSINDDGTLSNKRVLADFGEETGVDGMAVDAMGRIFAAVRAQSRFGIAVYDPQGMELAFMETPELPTNCCFGAGNDQSSLYITVGTGLYRLTLR